MQIALAVAWLPVVTACALETADGLDQLEAQGPLCTLGDGTVVMADSAGQVDASAALNQCLASLTGGTVETPAVLELPVGVYRVDQPVLITNSNLVVRTAGTAGSTEMCLPPGSDPGAPSPICAVLRAGAANAGGGPDGGGVKGLFHIGGDGVSLGNVRVEHVVIDGSRPTRRVGSCFRQSTRPVDEGDGCGRTVVLHACTGCQMTYSAVVRTLVGSAVSWGGDDTVFSHNQVIENGEHRQNGTDNMWGDGIAVRTDATRPFNNVAVEDNEFRNNGDSQIQLFGCTNCRVNRNSIVNDGSHQAFSGIQIGVGKNTQYDGRAGNFNGTEVAANVVDGGPSSLIDWGIALGSDERHGRVGSDGVLIAVHGIYVHDNTVRRARQGLVVNRAVHGTTRTRLERNDISGSGGRPIENNYRGCTVPKQMLSNLNIDRDSQVDKSGNLCGGSSCEGRTTGHRYDDGCP